MALTMPTCQNAYNSHSSWQMTALADASLLKMETLHGQETVCKPILAKEERNGPPSAHQGLLHPSPEVAMLFQPSAETETPCPTLSVGAEHTVPKTLSELTSQVESFMAQYMCLILVINICYTCNSHQETPDAPCYPRLCKLYLH